MRDFENLSRLGICSRVGSATGSLRRVSRFLDVCFLLAAAWLALDLPAVAQAHTYPWTVLIPQHDSRDAEVRGQDDFDSRSLVGSMNVSEKIFGHRLVWSQARIADLLSLATPFCELRFDAVKPLVLTGQEKSILREYFSRGGFVLFQQDCYPYDQDEFWPVKSWPVIDFLTRELPAADPDFTVTKITDRHPLFNQAYHTRTSEFTVHELQGNPATPNRTLVAYRGHPCAFVYGRYYVIEDGKWIAEPRPFPRVFSLDPRGYQLTVNIYTYVALH
jgi:hypothetical protein